MGHWECEDIIYVVEEYAGKGDVFNDIIARPEKYTERFVALSVVKPMLQALEYLHSSNIIHRWGTASCKEGVLLAPHRPLHEYGAHLTPGVAFWHAP